jgi:hypothetical protein
MSLTMDNDQILVKSVHNKCITILEWLYNKLMLFKG